ncbi:MAG: epimerase [Bacteroidetes bacterium]|nr:MAG: epimerase [Bacteroidota bacterium]
MKGMKIVIAGGSGFIGTALIEYFAKENDVVVLTRNLKKSKNNMGNKSIEINADDLRVKYVTWDAFHIGEWAKELSDADILINLTGRSVNCRYNYKNMKEIFDSRIRATRVLGEAIQSLQKPPRLWINIASATIYRNALDYPQDEYNGQISDLKSMNMPATTLQDLQAFFHKYLGWAIPSLFVRNRKKEPRDFSVRVCKKWEEAFNEITVPDTRKICIRLAITLGKYGVIVPYLNLIRWSLGGRQGNGKQMYSWVHVKDFCRAIEWFQQHKELNGTFNCSSPNPVTNKEFMSTLKKASGYIIGVPAFKWMLEMGAPVIGTETELILKSRWVLPVKLLESGFRFQYPLLPGAIDEILKSRKKKFAHKASHLHQTNVKSEGLYPRVKAVQ